MHLIKKPKVIVKIFISKEIEREINITTPKKCQCLYCSLDADKLGQEAADYLLDYPEPELNFINRNRSVFCSECELKWISGYFARKADWNTI